ncbi:MAG: hypothetical protein VB048_01610 [Bacteroidaceae bacterium]|nr:hypothetical protein [Bacteroidaceae bacterium]
MRRLYILIVLISIISINSFSQSDSLFNSSKSILNKGVSYLGFRIGFSKKDIENDRLLTIVDLNEVKDFSYEIALSGSWFIAENVAWGAKVNYGFSDQKYTISSNLLSLLIEAQTYSTNTATTNFEIGTGVKNYVPFGLGNRFFVFNETNISYNYISSLTRDVYDEGKDIKKSMKTTHELSLGLSPGVMYFLKKGFAFEFAFNPVMISYNRTFIKQDETKNGGGSDFAIDFKFNLLKIYFGFAYYFGI